jgi:uncharacterized LabA/DUF88 family protein
MAGKAAVFLDAGYIDKVTSHDFGGRRFDYQKLAAAMASPDELLRAYYYDCLPYMSSAPTEEEKKRYSGKHRFVTALNNLSRFEVRLGRLANQGGTFVQKRVDCMVGVDMALLAGKGRVDRVALFSGDSDLIPAVEAVKREGVLMVLWHAFSERTKPSRELFELCDDRVEVTPKLFASLARL